MRIADVIGRVTLSRCHPSLVGATWVIGVPQMLEGLLGDKSGTGEPFVIFDELGAGPGARVGVSEGSEASSPFYPSQKPIDGYVALIVDSLELADRNSATVG